MPGLAPVTIENSAWDGSGLGSRFGLERSLGMTNRKRIRPLGGKKMILRMCKIIKDAGFSGYVGIEHEAVGLTGCLLPGGGIDRLSHHRTVNDYARGLQPRYVPIRLARVAHKVGYGAVFD